MATQSAVLRSWSAQYPDTVERWETLGVAIRLMAQKRIGAVLVVEDKRLAGIFTERDLLNLLGTTDRLQMVDLLQRPVESFMTSRPVTAGADEDVDGVYLKMKSHGIRHIPIVDGEELVGIVSMRDLFHYYQNRLETAFLDAKRELDELNNLIHVSEDKRIVRLVDEIRRYRELSLTDHLTGLYNKRYFQARIVEETARARRYKQPLALVFCDVDYFKRVNDTHGHQGGDEVLRQTALVLSGAVDNLHVVSRLRKSDIVARYGGEEFVVILPETDERGAGMAAEKMRKLIEAQEFRVGEPSIRLTMSFGVAQLEPDDANHDPLVLRADHAMYVAKNSGRNRVVRYSLCEGGGQGDGTGA